MSAESLSQHVATAHHPMNEWPWRCSMPYCNSGFSTAAALKQHRTKVHNKPHEIGPIGNEMFGHFAAEKQSGPDPICHTLIDQPIKPTKSLNSRVNNLLKPWQCYSTSCNAKFATKSQLLEHLKTHSNFCHFCSTCRSNFPTESELDNHLKMSHGQYCDICNQTFQSATEFFNHTLTEHLQEKHHKTKNKPQSESDYDEYPCIICRKIYYSKWGLKVHTRKHHTKTADPDIYPCTVCRKIYHHPWGLKVHTRKHHPTHYYKALMDTYELEKEAENKPEVESEKVQIPTTQAVKKRYNCIYMTCDKQLESLIEFQHHIKEMHPHHSLSKIKFMENHTGQNDKEFIAMDESVKAPNHAQKPVSTCVGQINKEFVVVEKKAKDVKHEEYTIRVPVGANFSTIKTALQETQIIP